MLFGLFGTNRISTIGASLADQLSKNFQDVQGPRDRRAHRKPSHRELLQQVLTRARQEVVPLRLNFYKKARIANAFKWRLIENGVDATAANELTHDLVLQLSLSSVDMTTSPMSAHQPSTKTKSIKALIEQANALLKSGTFEEAAQRYQDILEIEPSHTASMNNLGACLCQLGRYHEAEPYFRRAVKANPKYAEAHANLGALLRGTGHLVESESHLRRAVKAKPGDVAARINLGLTLLARARPVEARRQFEKALRAAPSNTDGLTGMGQVAVTSGDFSGAEEWFRRALEKNPNLPRPWASLVHIKKMTKDDQNWLKRAEEIIATNLTPLDESSLRFAMGKYNDDVGNFGQAFLHYRRGNDLLKSVASPYDRSAHKKFVDDLVSSHDKGTIAASKADAPSNSRRPLFVVGMMRSGTSLVEQIIASHPKVTGAGELEFWTEVMHRHESVIRRGALDTAAKANIAESYLRTLAGYSEDAVRVIDKAPINSDYLGIINSIFPNARIIYLQRDAIDTCLSCYFQEFLPTMNFTLDLGDLADYYRQHRRLIDHWTDVLPTEALLKVPYGELVSDPEIWIRRILDFVGLEWDDNCLQFQKTQRSVTTASAWQVRQPIHRRSIERWRNYEKFIGPLRQLEGL